MVKHQKPQRSKKKITILVIILAVLIAASAGYLVYKKSNKSDDTSFKKTSTGHDVNLNPPTDEEKQEAEQNKDDISKEPEDGGSGSPNPGTPNEGAPRAVSPFITFAGQEGGSVELTGYVTGIFEEGGTCRAIFTKGSLKVIGESKGIEDADHTTCPPITIARSQFAQTGNWTVVLEYASSTAKGISKESRTVAIQ